jgi:hypothetical protein
VFQRLKWVAQFARLEKPKQYWRLDGCIPLFLQMFHWLCENEKLAVEDANQQEAKATCSAN